MSNEVKAPDGSNAKVAQEIAVSDHNGLVMLHFKEAIHWAALDPASTVALANRLAEFAYKAQFGDFPAKGKSSFLVEQKRVKLVSRFTIMCRSMINEGKDPIIMANALVDAAFNEVM